MNIIHLFPDGLDDLSGIGAAQHEHNPDHRFVTIQQGRPLPHGVPDMDDRDISDENRRAALLFDDDLFNIGQRLDEPDAPNDVFLGVPL